MKATIYIGTSLDGFIARKNGDIEWLVNYSDEEAGKTFEKFMERIDAMVMGRDTFDTVVNFPEWPYSKHVYVLSSSLQEIPASLKDKATLINMPPSKVLEFLGARGVERVYVDGGKTIQSFLNEDLVDEMIISTIPLLIGDGIPLFAALNADLQFKHTRTETYPNGLVSSYYERVRKCD